jgi:hypothetical protein
VGIFNTVLSEDDIMNIMNNGLKGATVAVEPAGKLATTWARLKQ